MTRYTNSYDSVTTKAQDAREAANIIARRIYGRRGYARTLRLDSSSRDGSSATYEAFIGVTPRNEPSRTVGRNIWIYASR